MSARFVVLSVLILGSCKAPSPERTAETAKVEPNPVAPNTDAGDAVAYKVSFEDAQNHYITVTATVPATGDETIMAMAVWTPGSYKVREYSRNLEAVSAEKLDGSALELSKVEKNRWRVVTTGVESFVMRYRVYARRMSVQENFVDAEFGVLTGAGLFVTPVGLSARSCDVEFLLRDGWRTVATAMTPHPSGAGNRFLAANYDVLIDSPVLVGNPNIHSFEVKGVPHRLVNLGHTEVWDDEKANKDIEALTRAHVGFWGTVPYPRYDYLNVLSESGGGLEHQNSTLVMTSRWVTRKREKYTGWLGLMSHEFFHTWNVKRLRPAALGPFDYENEVHTRSLWVAEGITSYYDDLMLVRAGLITEKEYLASLSKQVESVQTTPGRLVQSLSDASFDTWIKFYHRDENSSNVTTSYYRKGAVVGWLLDAEIRHATRGKKSLDDVMRLAYERYAGATGYTQDGFRALVAEVAGTPLDEFFADNVDGVKELDYTRAFSRFGLEFAPEKKEEDEVKDGEPAYLGVEVDKGTISSVKRGTPAYTAGLNVGDELIAMSGYRVRDLSDRLSFHRPGEVVEVTVARRGKLVTLRATLGAEPEESYKIQVAPNAPMAANRYRAAWLGTAQ